MLDSPLFVPSGAAVLSSPTPSESRDSSPEGEEINRAQHRREEDITELDGEQLGDSEQMTMAAAPDDGPAASTAGEDKLPLSGDSRFRLREACTVGRHRREVRSAHGQLLSTASQRSGPRSRHRS